MNDTVRVQFYHWDTGLFRKSYIQEISREELTAIQRADKGSKIIVVTDDDWFGRKLPAVLRNTYQRQR